MAKFSYEMDDVIKEIINQEFTETCPECNSEYIFSISDVGSSVTCPKCGLVINIESAD